MKIRTVSGTQTKSVAEKIAKEYRNKGGVIALIGELGTGKTTFAQGFAKGLGVKEKVISPTFVLMRQHQIPFSKKILYHLDLYRLEDKSEIKQLGLEDLFEDSNSIVLIEWAEKIMSNLPKKTLIISFKNSKENSREISISSLKT